jgi:hypothetical protein
MKFKLNEVVRTKDGTIGFISGIFIGNDGEYCYKLKNGSETCEIDEDDIVMKYVESRSKKTAEKSTEETPE